MCGIAGYLSFSKSLQEDELRAMTNSLAHRGPDAEGFYRDEFCGLGHRRLSIIDLSEKANQPMFSSNGRFVIVYNGEVYNYRELGAKLKQSNAHDFVRLKTASDTEVILEAFSQLGPEFVQHLNGMFAITLYDIEKNELYCFRDRVGIKPFFYYWDGTLFAFASELKSLLKIDRIGKELNHKSIHDFLHLGFIPAPSTIYSNIHKLEPGTMLKVNRDGIKKSKYWSVEEKLSADLLSDREQAMVKLSDLMMSSVQFQLKSDVPFGVFLSGGIDSSLVTAQAVIHSSVPVNTFSIGFEEISHNESEHAKAIAAYLGTNHHEFIVSYRDALKMIEPFFEAYDEPFADPSAIPTMLVSKLASEYVTVTLSGEGGDELFFGYGSYRWARRLAHPLFKKMRLPLAQVFHLMSSRYQRIEQLLRYEQSDNIRSHILSQEQYFFTHSEIVSMLMPPYNKASASILKNPQSTYEIEKILAEPDLNDESRQAIRKLNAMEQQALFDLFYYLPDDLLTKVDRASMRFSIETRVPFLDHRLVEFAENIDPKMKFHNGISKYILKEILYQYIPRKFFERPKQGFSIPMNRWLKCELRFLVEEYLNPETVKRAGILNPVETEKMVRDFFAGKDYLYNRIWITIVLQKWMLEHRN
ncbi:MAG: hypothetical protein RLZZ630_1124 [Bacteroidota bacterium]|jgi:asparagine synthase (glutamine-hydrolysing)